MERNKEISVLKKESKSLSRILGEMKQELDVLTATVNAQQERRKFAAMMIYEMKRLLLSSKVVGDDCWQERTPKASKRG
jgi:chloramphenicol O-acetyltransferase